jgi:antitoxin (DNA-binding transcriptional repressor) of toxin-antitoxin stability system
VKMHDAPTAQRNRGNAARPFRPAYGDGAAKIVPVALEDELVRCRGGRPGAVSSDCGPVARGTMLEWTPVRLADERGGPLGGGNVMAVVGVRELEEHASEIIHRVREQKEWIDITDHGEVVARLVPVLRPVDQEAINRIWEEEDRLAEEIGKYWPVGLSAADAIAEDRE